MTRKTKIIVITASVLAVAAAGWFFISKGSKTANNYTFVEVKRGDIQSVVSSTGTLGALVTVQVGTQVSGTIGQLFADFNQNVQKGQLLATLETDLLDAAVRDAQASVDKARVQLDVANDDYKRNEPLFKKGYLSAEEFNQYRGSLAVAQAGLKNAQAALDRSRTNLGYAQIRSPISGTVIQRNVDVGQTVAASLSTPTLFLIAEDLSRMQISVNVDESDIGTIKVGQTANFSVQSFPDKKFTGTVRQVRLQPTTVQNVVNYTVIVDASNTEGVLIPGMTATVDFNVQEAKDVLMVPNAALRFQATPEMIAEAAKNSPAGATGDSTRGQGRGAGTGAGAGTGGGTGGTGARTGTGGGTGTGTSTGGDSTRRGRTGARNFSKIWYLDSAGNLKVLPVRTGLTDGQNTEVMAKGLEPGMKVISGVQATGATKTPSTGGGLPGTGTNRQAAPGAGGGGGRLF
ncbi:MAG: putative macrolide-specific efflux protein [Chlorobi bacterium]|nr:putative macrolide-specific efflux protein [Chlorobiota bacterium]